jgi:hypothetical protein
MTDGRGFEVSESCMGMFFHRDGVLDSDDGFSSKERSQALRKRSYLTMQIKYYGLKAVLLK